jgi:hypothetical protein
VERRAGYDAAGHRSTPTGRAAGRQALDALSPPTRSKLAGWVEAADDRFRGYTIDDPAGRMGKVAEVDPTGRGWWWRRVPDSGPIVEDLARYA